MARVVLIGLAVLAAIVPTTPIVAWQAARETVVDDTGFVREFYGVPLDLKIHDLEQSKLKFTPGWAMGEGSYYPSAKIFAEGGVELVADFSEEGDLYMLKTRSPNAIGPRRSPIGASLEELRKNWPEGKLSYGTAHGRYVVFSTGTNVYFNFNPDDMPPGSFDSPPVPRRTPSGEWLTARTDKPKPDLSKLKVIEIRISSREKN